MVRWPTYGKPSKYKNVRTEIDGITFDSKAEARRYTDLKNLQRAGEIKGFILQPSFPLETGIRYRPDFLVCGNDGICWVEDVKSKGTITQAFKIKHKLWKARYPFLELRVIDQYGGVIYSG